MQRHPSSGMAANMASMVFDRAERHYARLELDQAETLYLDLLRHNPEAPEILFRLGRIAHQRHNYKQAKIFYRKAIKGNDRLDYLHRNLGMTLCEQGLLKEAEKPLRQALKIASDNGSNHTTLGYLQRLKGDMAAAEASYRKAVEVAPDNADCHKELGYFLLFKGDYREGWALHEYRWRGQRLTSAVFQGGKPLWDGVAMAGEVLLIHAEQGLGDTIQFLRYVPLAVAQSKASKVILRIQAGLLSLLPDLGGQVEIQSAEEGLVDFDRHCPLEALPHRVYADGPLRDFPKLCPDPSQALALQPGPLKIGLAWAGNPIQPNDHRRSTTLAKLMPGLQALHKRFGNIELISFQRDINEKDRALMAKCAFMRDCGYLDMAAIAATMPGLDLMITVDTAMGHLAGALDVPTWLLLSNVPDFRWGPTGDQTSWYPSLRLIRQEKDGDWAGVARRIGALEVEKRADATGV
ncbi:tetratricopeptide repeat protein [Aestuariispira insulae]|uniref:tetratricopeptide repeat-containing glycosyltransferase family protein n=1 Tax=Aestuariispira insulae TaxID=1461337 RepID=UPI0011C04BDC|nr:tetratricopeptide repeat protein [Aestuariispira insulae]